MVSKPETGQDRAAAWDQMVRLSDPSDPAHHPVVRSFAVGDLVGAAVHSGHRAEVEPIVADLEATPPTPSPSPGPERSPT